jgi:hypothetical protein
MNHDRKHVFTLTLDSNKGETPDLLMVAIAMAIFEKAPALHDDESGIADERYAKADVLTEDEARSFVRGGREVSMLFVKARMCLAHVLATRLSPEKAEIVFTMYDQDHEALMERVSECMDRLVLAHADDTDVELDEFDIEFLDEVEDTLRVPMPISA